MQIISYNTGGDSAEEPALVVGSESDVTSLPLATGTELSYTLLDRHCVGQTTNSKHHSCPSETVPYCRAHDDLWQCAICTGDCSKPLDSCDEEHAVYIAAFAPKIFKVGVTRSWRLETRLREQGADRAVHIRTVADGRLARQIEAEIAETLVDRVRVPKKIKNIHQSVEDDAWNALISKYDVIEDFDFDYEIDLSQQPLSDTFLSGTVYGTQGRVLLLEKGGSIYGVDMRDLLGYDITQSTESEELQSSFSSFD